MNSRILNKLSDIDREARKSVSPAIAELNAKGYANVLPVPIEDIILFEFPLDIRPVERLTIEYVRSYAAKLGISLDDESAASQRLAGYLLAGKDWGVIFVDEDARNPEHIRRQRYSAAHELGHYMMEARQVLTDHSENVLVTIGCSYDDMRKTNGYAANERYQRWLNEVMANKFAAEVLMPFNDVCYFINTETPSFQIIDKMTDRYGTSLSSCAIRYINTTKEDCALVYSKDGIRQWFIPSNSLTEENSRYTIPKMHRLGQGTSAYSLARGLAPGREVSGRPFASEWFPVTVHGVAGANDA